MEAAAAGLTRADKYGLDPADVLVLTWAWRDFGDAEDVGAVMSWRIETHLDEQEHAGVIEPLKEPGADTGYYEWAIDRSARNHPDVARRVAARHLGERADYIDQRMSLRGAELTVERPAWTEQLGPFQPTRKRRGRGCVSRPKLTCSAPATTSPPPRLSRFPSSTERARRQEPRQSCRRTAQVDRNPHQTPVPPRLLRLPNQLRRISELARRVERNGPSRTPSTPHEHSHPDRPTGSDARLADLLRKARNACEDIKRTGDDLATKTERNRAEQPDVDGPASTPDLPTPTHKGPRIG